MASLPYLFISKMKLWFERWPLRWQIKNLILWILTRYQLRIFKCSESLKPLNREQKERLNLYYKNQGVDFTDTEAITARDLKLNHQSYYCGDMLSILYPNYLDKKFHKEFGDVTWVPSMPTFVKSRPINEENQNSILLPLGVRRHMQFPMDPYKFIKKKPSMVWRGAGYQAHRKVFLEKAHALGFCDVGDPNLPKTDRYYKPRLSIHEQMQFKYIISIEGNDVATNLKWIMHSNSLCIMPKPKFETWFLESRLKAGVHYAEVSDDFNDLEKVFRHYEENQTEALEIISNANAYTQQFLDRAEEKLLSRHVCAIYFSNCKSKES